MVSCAGAQSYPGRRHAHWLWGIGFAACVAQAWSQSSPPAQRFELKLSGEIGARRVSGPANPANDTLHLKLAQQFAAESAPASELAGAQIVIYVVRINGQDGGEARMLRLADGRLLALRGDLAGWRLRIPDRGAVRFGADEYFPLNSYPGLAFNIDEARQEIAVQAAPANFTGTVIESPAAVYRQPESGGAGAFGNYDLVHNSTPGLKRTDSLVEAGWFNRYGVGVTSFLARDIGGQSNLVRLDSTWTVDFPQEIKTLTLGDTIGSSGIWGRPVRYGGLRYGTNFATRPGFITFPLPGLAGEAVLPTTTELYVNGVLRQSGTVPPGPFRLNNLPVFTGQGEVRLVVRDMLGREQVMVQPYFASNSLLREGLIDESGEIGMVRNNYGLRGEDYGRFVAAIQRRKGISGELTAEARAELLREQQTAGLGASIAVPALGLLTAAGALSRGPAGIGELFSTALERPVHRGTSVALRAQWTSANFTQLGLQQGQRAPLRLVNGSVGFAPDAFGSLGVSYIRQDNRDQPDIRLLSANYSLSIGKSSALIVSAVKTLAGERTSVLSVVLSMGFGERTSGSVQHTSQSGRADIVAQLQEGLPPGAGTGFRILAGTGASGNREEIGYSVQTDTGTYAVEAGQAGGVTSYRLNASGGAGYLGGHAFLSRRMSESFGIAEVPGYPGVGVYLNNQLVGRTNADGMVQLPRLLPYQSNPVRIDPVDLPLDSRIDAIELDAIPYFRSGILVKFPVVRTVGALVALVLEDGGPMPVGATVTVAGQAGDFPVAQRGEVYATGLGDNTRITARWNGQTCDVVVRLPANAGPIPRIGPLTCLGVKR